MLNNIYKFVILFVSLIIIIGGYLLFFFDPDNFRSEIEEYVSSKINYTFIYDGSLDVGLSDTGSNAYMSISGIRILDEASNPVKSIANIGRLVLIVNKDKLADKVIDVDKAEAEDIIYFGTNIDEVLVKTYSLLKFKKFGGINQNNNTAINKIYSNAIINKNIMTINKLYLETQLMQSNGKGTIDLISKRIKIDMIGQIRGIQDMTLTNSVYINHYPEDLVDKELPIRIRGTIDNPDVTIDMKDIIKKEIIDPIKEKIIDKIQDELKEKLKLPF